MLIQYQLHLLLLLLLLVEGDEKLHGPADRPIVGYGEDDHEVEDIAGFSESFMRSITVVRRDSEIGCHDRCYRKVILSEHIVAIEQHHDHNIQKQICPRNHLVSNSATILHSANLLRHHDYA